MLAIFDNCYVIMHTIGFFGFLFFSKLAYYAVCPKIKAFFVLEVALYFYAAPHLIQDTVPDDW